MVITTETIIAEKFETIISRNVLTTRVRDYYDVYMLVNTQSKNMNNKTLKDVIRLTAEHRESTEKINNWKEIVKILKDDEQIQKLLERYRKDNFYAKEIEYNELISTINKVGQIFDE